MLDPRRRLHSPIAQPVMRSRPAHISLTDASTTADALSPPNKKGPHKRTPFDLPLDKNPLHISSIGFERAPVSTTVGVRHEPSGTVWAG